VSKDKFEIQNKSSTPLE